MFANGRRITAILAASATVAAAGFASAATTKRYAGKVKNAGPVTFQVKAGSVRTFRASVSVRCGSSSTGQSESYLVAPTRTAKLDKHGRFTLRFAKDKQTGGPFPLYKINATVRGRVSGASSSGTVEVTYYKNALVSGRLVLMGCGSGKLNWTAKRK